MDDGCAWLRHRGTPRPHCRTPLAEGGAQPPPGTAECQLVGRSVLIAEPLPVRGEDLAAMLRAIGMRPHLRTTGIEAVAFHQGSNFFDLLVTELHGLGARDGLGVIRLLRQRRPWLPVLMLTDDAPPAKMDSLSCLGEGPTTVLTRPAAGRKAVLEAIGRMLAPRCHPPG